MSKGPIPRVFHRIWLGGPMPPEFEAYGESWRRLHPGWRQVLWTEQNLPKLINQKEFDGARALAQKADIARYEILYEQGGVYLDCDFECFRPIDELVDGVHCFAATEDLTWVSIGILGAVPKHALLRAVIDEIPRSVATQHDAPINIQTGPLLFTRVVAARRMRLERDDLVVFPPKVFYPYRYGQKRPPREQMPDAYGAHHWAASWMKPHGSRTSSAPAPAPANPPGLGTPAGAEDTQPGFAAVAVHAAVMGQGAAPPVKGPSTTMSVAAPGGGDDAAAPVKGTIVTVGTAATSAKASAEAAVAPSVAPAQAPALAPALAPATAAGATAAGATAAGATAGPPQGSADADMKDDLHQPEKFRILAALDPEKPDAVLLLLVAFGRLFHAGERVELGIYAYSEPSLPLLHCVQQLLAVIIGDLTKTAELSLLSRAELAVLPYQVAFVPSGNAIEDSRGLFDAVHGLWLIRQTLDAWRDGQAGPAMPAPMRRDWLVRRAAKRPTSEGATVDQSVSARTSSFQGLHGTYIGEDRVLVHTVYGRPLLAAARDRSITPELMLTGCYDQPLVRFLSTRLAPGDVAFDIGANVGFFTILMGTLVGPEGRVVAYEASPAPFALLLENVTTNYMNDRVTTAPLAAWSEAKRLSFHASERFCGNGSIRAKDDAYRKMYPTDRIRTIEVDAEPLDQRWSKLERIDVVKIDVEGAEFQVLRGMQGLLRSGAVRSVVFECVRSHLGADWQAFLDLLRSLEQELHMGFSTIAMDGQLVALSWEALAARGNFTQVVMERKS